MSLEQPSSRVERKREETQAKIIRAAVQLFNQQGLEATTMEQIAEAADIAKGTLYNHFPSKDAIISGFLQRTFQERSEGRVAQLRALPDTRTRLARLFTQLVEGVRAQKDIFEAFMVYRMRQVISFRPVADEETGHSLLIHEIIQLGRESGELRADLPANLLEDFIEFALIEAIKPFYLTPETYDAQRVIEQCVELFMNGAKA